MRSEVQMLKTILTIAEKDHRIRAVILTGSRTNPEIIQDDFQDFDVIFLVKELVTFRADPGWIDIFGDRIILQMPNSMKIDDLDTENQKKEITYLMLFKDFNRIDLKLVETENRAAYLDSLSTVLLDKDNLLHPVEEPSDKDYWIVQPTEQEFRDCCNEFWWVMTYVFKGLARDEPLYAKAMLEGPVRNMFMKMLAWSVGVEKGFKVNLGNGYRFLRKFVTPMLWSRILRTYPDASLTNIWVGMNEMMDVFHDLAINVADQTGLKYNMVEAQNVREYIRHRPSKFRNTFSASTDH